MNKGNPTNQLAPREMYDVDRDVGEGVGTASIQQVEKHRDQRDHRRDGELRVRVDGAGQGEVRRKTSRRSSWPANARGCTCTTSRLPSASARTRREQSAACHWRTGGARRRCPARSTSERPATARRKRRGGQPIFHFKLVVGNGRREVASGTHQVHALHIKAHARRHLLLLRGGPMPIDVEVGHVNVRGAVLAAGSAGAWRCCERRAVEKPGGTRVAVAERTGRAASPARSPPLSGRRSSGHWRGRSSASRTRLVWGRCDDATSRGGVEDGGWCESGERVRESAGERVNDEVRRRARVGKRAV